MKADVARVEWERQRWVGNEFGEGARDQVSGSLFKDSGFILRVMGTNPLSTMCLVGTKESKQSALWSLPSKSFQSVYLGNKPESQETWEGTSIYTCLTYTVSHILVPNLNEPPLIQKNSKRGKAFPGMPIWENSPTSYLRHFLKFQKHLVFTMYYKY